MKKHIPNAITSMNLLCGVIGVIFAMNGRVDTAFLLMLAAAACDFCDGLAARLLNAYSPVGKELDSLADVVSFGVLPALILYQLMSYQVRGWLTCIPLVFAVFAALRLAKFNIDERQHDTFLGLPAPAAAMICGSLAYYVYHEPFTVLAQGCGTVWFIPAVALVLSLLMVCEIPMFTLKFGGKSQADLVTRFGRIAILCMAVIAVIITLVARLNWSMAILMTLVAYLLVNLVFWLFPATRRK